MLILSCIYDDFIMYLCWFYDGGIQGNAETRASRERWKQAFKVTLKPGLQGNAETRAPMERLKQAFKATLKPGLQGNAETRAPREPWKPWNPWKPWPWKPENFENLENLKLGIVCTRRSRSRSLVSNGGVTCAPTCTMHWTIQIFAHIPDRLVQTNAVHIIDPISVEMSALKTSKLGIVCTRRSCKRLLFQTVVWHARQLALWIKQFKYLLPSLTVLCKQMQCTLSTRFWSKSQVSKFSRYSRLQGLNL